MIMTVGGIFNGPPAIGKNVHKKLATEGILIEFNGALDPTSAGNPGNYTVLTNSKHGKRTITTPVAISSVEYSAGVGISTVAIRFSKQAFAHGGELEVNGSSPSGIANATDTLFLTGSTTFTITRNDANPIHPA